MPDTLLICLAVLAATTLILAPASMQRGGLLAAASAIKSDELSEWYFYNEVTGEVQLEDPGDTPYETEAGVRFWVVNGAEVHEDPNRGKYTWVEMFSSELKKPYFYNQETKESTWERPVDLAWRRIRVTNE